MLTEAKPWLRLALVASWVVQANIISPACVLSGLGVAVKVNIVGGGGGGGGSGGAQVLGLTAFIPCIEQFRRREFFELKIIFLGYFFMSVLN